MPPRKRKFHNFLPILEDKDLPICEYKDVIVKHIEENRLTLIEGETGCGKSTMVPLFLLEDSYLYGKHLNLLITQPRKIAARTLAERVSDKTGKMLGDVVGYRLGSNLMVSGNTKITFVTTSNFLQVSFSVCFVMYIQESLPGESIIVLDFEDATASDLVMAM